MSKKRIVKKKRKDHGDLSFPTTCLDGHRLTGMEAEWRKGPGWLKVSFVRACFIAERTVKRKAILLVVVGIAFSLFTRTLDGRRDEGDHNGRHQTRHGDGTRGASHWLRAADGEVTDSRAKELSRNKHSHDDCFAG